MDKSFCILVSFLEVDKNYNPMELLSFFDATIELNLYFFKIIIEKIKVTSPQRLIVV